MSNTPLSPKIRWRAALCHWSGFLWLPSGIIITLVFSPNVGLINNLVDTIASPQAIGFVFLTILIRFLLWRIWRSGHEFIDRSGREAVNFSLSFGLYLVFSIIVLVIIGMFLKGWDILLVIWGGLAAFTLAMLFHSIVVAIGGKRALAGIFYKYPFTIGFLR